MLLFFQFHQKKIKDFLNQVNHSENAQKMIATIFNDFQLLKLTISHRSFFEL